MISSWVLRVVLWIIAPFAFFGNIFVLVTSIRSLESVKSNLIAVAHRYMVINLSIADGLMGVYLILLIITSTIYSGSFCLTSATWRSSVLCKIMGTIVVVSNQASVYILFQMGLFRLYTIIRPFEVQFSESICKMFYKSLFATWIFAIVLAILPWCLDYFITDYYYISLFFETDQVSKNSYTNFVERVLTIANFNKIDQNSTVVAQKSFFVNGMQEQQNFSSKLLPPLKYSGSFGFYSQNVICLPSYFSRNNQPGWQYSLALISLDFTMFVLMVLIYILIVYFGNPTRHPAIKAKTGGSCYSNGKLNFQKCRLHGRVARLILTDFLCWIPLCVLSYAYFGGVDYDNSIMAISGIILLPINSALNPILYSELFDSLLKKSRGLCAKIKLLGAFQCQRKDTL